MKKFKKIFICLLLTISAFSCCLFSGASNAESSNEQSNAVTLASNAFSYISLSQAGQPIDSSKFTTLDEKTYIITNKSVTINFQTLKFNYTIDPSVTQYNFFPNKKTVTLEKDADEKYPTSFDLDDTTYYYAVSNDNVYIYNSPITQTSVPVVSSASSSLISYELDGEAHKFTFIMSYASNEDGFKNELGESAESCEFKFRVAGQDFYLSFQKPVVNFYKLSNPIVMFNTFTLKDEVNYYPAEKSLAPNQIFDKLQIEFLNNDYTEANPLYFKINFNGFVYEYKLYSKVIEDENLLFVEYTDESSSSGENAYNNSESLATTITPLEDDDFIIENDNKVFAKTGDEFNKFSLIFTKTGRYSIEFYDSTYIQNMVNANYYSTSFFIREAGEDVTPFENIYIVAETMDDNKNHIDYIVSDSVLNYSTKITVKNLGDFGLDAVSGQDIKLEDVIENIIVKRTDFGIDRVETIDTIYTVEDILEKLVDNDFVLEFHDDAYYQIFINEKLPEGTAQTNKNADYVFTIVKYAKTTFTFHNVTYEASRPYFTDIRNYTNKIESEIIFNMKFSTSAEKTVNLEKTFINRFNIKFGIKKVSIEEYEKVATKDDEKIPAGVYLKVYGVGDITVTLTYNGVTEVFTLNSEVGNNTIDRTEYGTYVIKIVDSMGSETTKTVVFKKGLNTSAIILIVLSSIIGTVVALFVIKARGKVATR